MSKFDNKSIMPRYYVLAVVMMLVGILVVCKAAYIMTFERSYWEQVADRLKNDSVPMSPQRGNILTENGDLLASSLPQYNIYMDFKTLHKNNLDTLWTAKQDSICQGLNRIFPEISARDFQKRLEQGKDSLKSHWLIIDRRVSFSDFSEVQKLPIFSMKPYKGGFHYQLHSSRSRPYGELAERTIGEMYGSKDSARSGLELFYDKTLRGESGYFNRRKVMSKYLNIMVKDPTDGSDIVSTIDINIQDLAERSLRQELQEVGAELGVAIVMECSTGDVKAMTSLTRCGDGVYRELQNNAVSAMVEPGSVFKTASIMVALEDGKIDTTRKVDTGGGVWQMYGREMRDHNWRRGGYGTLSVPQVLQRSSNIGVSRLIDQYYHNDPEKYVAGLNRLGLGMEMQLPFFYDRQGNPIKTSPRIRHPKKDKHGRYTNWSNTTLPWMSIGYECQVPPIYTVSFYNAIANHGRFMQPRFVKEVRKDGHVVQSFDPVCLKEHIASDKTISQISKILESVVSIGLGRKAGSDKFHVAGKTGTAQIADEKGSYKSGVVRYWLSFCGFFPYEDPKYSCIVCIKKVGSPASGGGMCGPVFKAIAEGVMAQNVMYDIALAKDQHSIMFPDVKAGNITAADYVLTQLGFKNIRGWDGNWAHGNPIWGVVRTDSAQISFARHDPAPRNEIPDVTGMGARDAVYLMESRGVRVTLNGRGKVRLQSIAPGTRITKGMFVALDLG